jgi:uncharacterized protein (UPF0335 family)
MQKEQTINLNEDEAKKLLLEYVNSIQKVDNAIASLKEQRKDIFNSAKSNGFNKKIVNQVITKIRKELKQDETEMSEEEIYEEIIKQSGIVDIPRGL